MKNENNTPINFGASTSRATLGIPANLQRERSSSFSEVSSLPSNIRRGSTLNVAAALKVASASNRFKAGSRRGSHYNLSALPIQESMGSTVSLAENINRTSESFDRISKQDLVKLYDYINKITEEEGHDIWDDTFAELKKILKNTPANINQTLIDRFFNEGWNVISDDNSSLLIIAIEKADETKNEENHYVHSGNIEFLLRHIKEELILNFAVKSGEIKYVKSVINLLEKAQKLENEINAKDEYGKTPLHYAAESGNKEILEFIINKIHELEFNIKEEINGQDRYGKTALHYAAESGSKDCFTLLLEKGAKFSDDIYNRSELHFAAESGKIELLTSLIELLKKKGTFKIKINKKDKYMNNLLHYAAKSGSKECIQYLISKSVFFTKNKYNETPLHCIASIKKNKVNKEEYKKALESLIHEITFITDIKEELNQSSRRGYTPLHLAATHGNMACIEILIRQGIEINNQNSIDGSTALHCAVIHGHLDCVELLLSRGANADIKDKDGKTLVHLAAMYGHKDCLEFLVKKFPYDVHTVDDIENTPLHLAFICIQGNTYAQINLRKECIKLLIETDAKIDKQNKEGDTPLHLAAQFSHKECLEFLIEEIQKSIDLNEEIFRENKDEETAIHMAAFGGNIECLKYLMEKFTGTEDIKEIFSQKNKDGETLLHLAALSGSAECVEFIIGKMENARIDIKDALSQYNVNNKAENLLHLAALSGNKECASSLIKLIKDKFEVDDQAIHHLTDKSKYGNSTLHIGAMGGNKECFQYLCEKIPLIISIEDLYPVEIHEEIISSNTYGCTPLHLAAMCFNVEIIEYIISQKESPPTHGLYINDKKLINRQCRLEKTPLHYAVINDSELRVVMDDDRFILQKRKENQYLKKKVIKSLLYIKKENGKQTVNDAVDFDIKDNEGKTVLDYVLSNFDTSIMELFKNAFCERKEKLEQKHEILEKKYQKPHKYVSRINSIISPIMGIAVTIAILLRQSDSPIKIGASIIAVFCSCVAILGVIVGYCLERKENKLKSKIQNYSEKIKQIEDRIDEVTGKGKKGYRTARERDELLDRLLDIYLPNISKRDQDNQEHTEEIDHNRRKSVNKRNSVTTIFDDEKTPKKPSVLKRILNKGKSITRQDAVLFTPNPTPNCTPKHSILLQSASLTSEKKEAVRQKMQVNDDYNFEPIIRPRADSDSQARVQITTTDPDGMIDKYGEDYRPRTKSDLSHCHRRNTRDKEVPSTVKESKTTSCCSISSRK